MNFAEIRSTLSNSVCTSLPKKFLNVCIRKKENKYYVYFVHGTGTNWIYTCIISDNDPINKKYEFDLLVKHNLQFIPATLEEQLRAERMRSNNDGMTYYDIDENTENIVFKCNGIYYSSYLTNMTQCANPVRLNMSNSLGVQRCPVNHRLLAFVRERNVHVIDINTNASVKCTNTSKDIGSGLTHFVIEEEFDRYDGLWWRPNENHENEFHLLIEEFNESAVEEVIIPNYVNGAQSEHYKYPRPGKPNATSTLKIIKLKCINNPNINNVYVQFDSCLELPKPLMELFPEYEYMTNAGWTHDGKYVWVQLITRTQNVLTTFLIPFHAFRNNSTSQKQSNYAVRFCEENNQTYWVSVNFTTRFLKNVKQTSKAVKSHTESAIIGQQNQQYNHLYYIVKSWDIRKSNPKEWTIIESEENMNVPLTQGKWVVNPESIWIDENQKLVYFRANKDNDISNYLYKVNYGSSPTHITQITSKYTDAFINTDLNKAIVVESALNQPGIVRFIDLQTLGGQFDRVIYEMVQFKQIYMTNIDPPNQPKLLKYRIGDYDMYGLLYLPKSESTFSAAWPTLHYVYGGPGVRMVEDKFPMRFHLLAQRLNHFGFAMLVCDCRGSFGRGYEFEGFVKYKMGQIEMKDQIDFLECAAKDTGLIDMKNVAIHGTSYGGYLTIMAMLNHNDVYKCGFSCSPVTDWKLYDTAYTERYMGLPDDNEDAYRLGCAMTYIEKLPINDDVLLIAHGGLDENVHFHHTGSFMEVANKCGKNIRLLFYPSSRHGIDNRLHLETHLILYLYEKLIKKSNR